MAQKRVSDLEQMSWKDLEDCDLILVSDIHSNPDIYRESIGPVTKCISVGDLKAYFIRELTQMKNTRIAPDCMSEWNRILHELQQFGERLQNESNRSGRVRKSR